MKQFVSFYIQNHWFGVDILNVLEIFSSESITEIPKCSGKVQGLINVRGQIVVVFDLSAALGFTESKPRESLDIVLLKSQGDIKKRQLNRLGIEWEGAPENVGLHIDAIGDIVETSEPLNPLPASIDSIERKYVEGVVKKEKRLLIVLRLQSIFAEL